MEKQSADMMSTLKNVLASIGVGAGIGGGVMGTGYLIDKLKKYNRGKQLPIFFDAMLMKNPDLSLKYSGSKEDKEKLEDIFAMLEHFAPRMAENPVASGVFVRKVFELGTAAPDSSMIEALSKITKNYSDTGDSLSSGALHKVMDNSIATGFKFDPFKSTRGPEVVDTVGPLTMD